MSNGSNDAIGNGNGKKLAVAPADPVAGLAPLDDLRGQPDADGRVMHSTIVALADEIASAAELASGKTSRQPVVLVRGAPIVTGTGTGTVTGDVVMPVEMDLFR